jgi:hypothetical protein
MSTPDILASVVCMTGSIYERPGRDTKEQRAVFGSTLRYSLAGTDGPIDAPAMVPSGGTRSGHVGQISWVLRQ